MIGNEDYYGDRIGFLKVDEYAAIDIDSEFDFDLVEFLMKKFKADTAC